MGRSGTGLGLTVVWNSVQDNDGVITVESDTEGTVFSLYFPAIHDALVGEVAEMDLKDLVGKGEQILIVDDEMLQLDIASQMLHVLGYRVVTASSGEEAIRYLEKNRVDLILLDMIMKPGISGFSTFVKAIEIQPELKAIVVSGFSENNDVRRTQGLGAGQLVRKPYNLNEIGKALKEELS